MDLFDPNNEGSINCSHFSKTFLAMGFEERSRENRESIEKQRAAEQARLEAHEKKQAELARKNGLKYTLDYTDEEHFSAMAKLLDGIILSILLIILCKYYLFIFVYSCLEI